VKRQLALFSTLWAAAALFHIGAANQWREHALLAIAAGWVLVQPGSTPALAVLAFLQIYKAAELSPYISNHWLFTAFVNIGLLLSLALLMVKRRRAGVDRAELFTTFAPAARLALIALYFFVVFHKLNADFFDPEVSCGVKFYAAQISRLRFLPDSAAFHIASIYATIGIEAAIPLLLCLRRTRNIGIIVGLLFHYVIALNPIEGFYNFSAMLFAMFALFAPEGLASDRVLESRPFRFGALSLAVMFAACALLSQPPLRGFIPGIQPALIVWTLYGAAAIAGFARYVWHDRQVSISLSTPFRMPIPLMMVLPIAVFLNGIMPYVGLKTETSWAMFSNLRTEGDRSNHWLVPASAQVFDLQRDLVQVTRSSDGFLQQLAIRHELVPYFEIRRRPEAAVTYLRGGVETAVDRVSEDPHFSRTAPWLQRKLLRFRPVDMAAKQRCLH
jgi:hypothetical protein